MVDIKVFDAIGSKQGITQVDGLIISQQIRSELDAG